MKILLFAKIESLLNSHLEGRKFQTYQIVFTKKRFPPTNYTNNGVVLSVFSAEREGSKMRIFAYVLCVKGPKSRYLRIFIQMIYQCVMEPYQENIGKSAIFVANNI